MTAKAASEYFEVFSSLSKTLRTWFVAYGIGAPVLFLEHDAVRQTLSRSNQAGSILRLFLAGVVLQVMITAVNKTIMWIRYDDEVRDDTAHSARRWVRFANWLSEQYWLDLLVDVVTLGCFARATYCIYSIVS
jgi:hypothetical protein